MIPSDGGIRVLQLDAERLNLSLSRQQAGAQFHHHVLVVYDPHPGDILLDPNGLELVLLPPRQEAVDGVLQLATVMTAPRGDPWCLLMTQVPLKISVMTLNSTRPRRGTLLNQNLGVEVMPMCPRRA
jgi:hypothetical protein